MLLVNLAQEEALTQREFASRMSSDPSTVRAILALRGLVVRQTQPTDALARTVALPAKGKRMFRQLWTAGEPVRTQILGELQPGEVAVLVRLLKRVAQALKPESVAIQPQDLSLSRG